MIRDFAQQTPVARLTKVEKAWLSPVEELAGEDVPYWVIGRRAAGWMQRVVDHFRGGVLFVQAGTGEGGEVHLDGVLHLRGPADTRVLARLIHHAHGVAVPDALLEPLVATVETRRGRPVARPLLADIGTSRKMIAQITRHLAQNPAGSLTPRQAALAAEVCKQGDKCGWKAVTMERWLMRRHADRFLKAISAYPKGEHQGRGIVICAGGPKYFTCAWVCVKMLRRLGCTLPVEFWHLGKAEMTPEMEALVAPLEVTCVDAHEVRQRHPARTLGGWEVKCYAILHSRFKDVLLLDADNVPVKNPEFLFDTPQYTETGAIFWPDCNRLGPKREIWRICGVRHRDEWEFESGQIVVDKERCWQALQLAMHYNEHSDFYYQHIYGDKETFHLAFRRTGKEYAMPARSRRTVQGTICQDDFGGRLLFQHRIKKWNIAERDKPTVGFRHDAECRGFLEELHGLWTWRWHGARRWDVENATPQLRAAAAELAATSFMYHRVGKDHRLVSLAANGTIGEGAADREAYWDLRETESGLLLEIFGADGCTCRLRRGRDGVWRGRWLRFEQMAVELTPQPESVGVPPVAVEYRLPAGAGGGGRDALPAHRLEACVPFADRFPRLIHQIWLGPNPLPAEFNAWSEGWRRQHPGWHHQLWRDAEAEAFPMVNRDAFDAAENFAMKADIFRYELLLRHGGLYADLDFECLRPIDPLLAQVGEEAFGGFEWPTVNHSASLSNALLGALPGSAFLRQVVAALPESIRLHATEREVHGVEYISRATGPAFLTRMAVAFPRITVFAQPVLYPGPRQRHVAYARHHLWGSWREASGREPARTKRKIVHGRECLFVKNGIAARMENTGSHEAEAARKLREWFPLRMFLSLRHRVDRREALLPRLAAAGLGDAEWFPAVGLEALRGDARNFSSPAKRSCALGKRLVLREAGRRKAAAVLFLEDDVIFCPDFQERIAALELPEDWGILHLGCLHVVTPEPVSPGLVRVRRAVDNHAIAIRAEWFLRVRAQIRGWGAKDGEKFHSDVLLSHLNKVIPSYAAYPNLTWQAETYSDLDRRKYSNYHPDGRQRWKKEVMAGLHMPPSRPPLRGMMGIADPMLKRDAGQPFIHLVPYSPDRNIATAYNESIASVTGFEWILLTDADVMFLTPDYGHLIAQVIRQNPGAGLITCFTNRVGPTCQRTPQGIMSEQSLLKLRGMALEHLRKFGASVSVIGPPVSGMFLLFRRETWKAVGGFKGEGMLQVDWRFSKEIHAASLPILRMDGLFVAHFYRLDSGEKNLMHLRGR